MVGLAETNWIHSWKNIHPLNHLKCNILFSYLQIIHFHWFNRHVHLSFQRRRFHTYMKPIWTKLKAYVNFIIPPDTEMEQTLQKQCDLIWEQNTRRYICLLIHKVICMPIVSYVPIIHSIKGDGVPIAMQSIFPPVSFEKWSLAIGSLVNWGPLASNGKHSTETNENTQ